MDLITQGALTEKIIPTSGDLYLAYDETSTRKYYLRCKKTGVVLERDVLNVYGSTYENLYVEEVEFFVDVYLKPSNKLAFSVPLKKLTDSLKTKMSEMFGYYPPKTYFVNPLLPIDTENLDASTECGLGSYSISGNIGDGGQIHVLLRPCLVGDSEIDMKSDSPYLYIVLREDTLAMGGQIITFTPNFQVELVREGSFTKLRVRDNEGITSDTLLYTRDETSTNAKVEKTIQHTQFWRLLHTSYQIDYKEQHNGWNSASLSYTKGTTYSLENATMQVSYTLEGKPTAYGLGFQDTGYVYYANTNTLVEVNVGTMKETRRWTNCPKLLSNLDAEYFYNIHQLVVQGNYVLIKYAQNNNLRLNIFKINADNSISVVELGKKLGKIPSVLTTTTPFVGSTDCMYTIVDGILHRTSPLLLPTPLDEGSTLDEIIEALDLVTECYKQNNELIRDNINKLITIIK